MARILVIDDEESYRVFLARRLERDGHSVRAVANGNDAAAILEGLQPDLIVVDWRLQEGENGIEVYEALRRRLPHTEGLLITGYPGEEVRAQASRARLNGPLEKPFELEALSNQVHAILAQRP